MALMLPPCHEPWARPAALTAERQAGFPRHGQRCQFAAAPEVAVLRHPRLCDAISGMSGCLG